MSFHPTKAIFGLCFVFIALVAWATGSDLDGDTVWLWAAAFGGLGLAGLIAAVLAIAQRGRR